MGELDGKVAVITGGASGIGEASVKRFIEEGARVVIADMQEERGQALADSLKGSAVFAKTDVTVEAQVKAAIEMAGTEWGRLDCVFNNAGFGGAMGPLEDTPVEDYDITMDVLVKGVFLGMKHAIPIMKNQGGGSLINTASVAALVCGHTPHFYSVAKAAVVQLTKTVALEVGENNIRVNAICPGFIVTPLSTNTVGRDETLKEKNIKITQAIPRTGQPDDIAQMACWLAGDRSTFVTGQAIAVDGGSAAGLRWSRQAKYQKSYHPIKVYRPLSVS
ncbi:MAG: glucose 1-dehydrogenase [Pseudomonadales bacterium]|nr:glucose 1-dehydrogenase [Pseudomonadales bacterium]